MHAEIEEPEETREKTFDGCEVCWRVFERESVASKGGIARRYELRRCEVMMVRDRRSESVWDVGGSGSGSRCICNPESCCKVDTRAHLVPLTLHSLIQVTLLVMFLSINTDSLIEVDGIM